MTFPVTVRVCARAEVLASSVIASADNHVIFIGFLIRKDMRTKALVVSVRAPTTNISPFPAGGGPEFGRRRA
jgi:hypothetical protein